MNWSLRPPQTKEWKDFLAFPFACLCKLAKTKQREENAMFYHSKGTQHIDCHVASCRFNEEGRECGLYSVCIEVRGQEAGQTVCASYKKR